MIQFLKVPRGKSGLNCEHEFSRPPLVFSEPEEWLSDIIPQVPK